jgi:hypothetical protein
LISLSRSQQKYDAREQEKDEERMQPGKRADGGEEKKKRERRL